jgi:hypothetical protein
LVPKVLSPPTLEYFLVLTVIQLLMTGPKLVFSFWLAQTLIPAFDIALSPK